MNELNIQKIKNLSLNNNNKEEIELIIEIEDYVELLSARTVKVRLNKQLTVLEALHKIAKKGNVYFIITNYSYAENNFDLVHINDQKQEIILPKTAKLHELSLKNQDVIILKKKKREEIRLIILIEDYQQRSCARQILLSFNLDQSIQEALHKIARKSSVNIPLNEENDYGLYYKGEFMEYTKQINSFHFQEREIINLKKKKEEEISLIVLIDDYKIRNCARQVSSLFKKNDTISTIIQKICKKQSVQIPENEISYYCLTNSHTGEVFQKKETLEQLGLKNRDALLLKKISNTHTQNGNIINLDSGIISYSDLEFTQKIGQGSYGKVFRGIYQGTIEVAIKVLKDSDKKGIKEFENEIEMLKKYSHPNIIKLFGTSSEPKLNRICIVMELCNRGSLYHVMNTPAYEIGWDRFFKFSIEALQAVDYLHNQNPAILHRDLKSLNLLVTEQWDIKLCDFGLSRAKEDKNLETLRKLRTTAAWCAPELLEEKEFTIKSDIFGVGMILWEILYRCIKGKYQRPFAEFRDITFDYQIIVQAAKKDRRPTIPPTAPPSIVELIIKCWEHNPEKRPNSSEIIHTLIQLQQDYIKDPQKWDGTKDISND